MDDDRVFGVGFFERLNEHSREVSFSQGPDSIDVFNSIKANVSNVLNARSGEAQSSPDLGLIDFNDALMGVMDLSLRAKIAIKQCLDLYEPRLCNIRIQTVKNFDNPLDLCFQIYADVNSDVLHDKVKIDLILGNDRKYRVY